MQSHNTKILYAVGVGMILSDIIPTPADGIYFSIEQKLKEKITKGQITPKQYWIRDSLAYYGLNPLWWGGVLAASIYFGKTYEQKRNIMLSLIAGGLVIGVLYKNVKKDEKMYAELNSVKNQKQ
jgi:uncharacterized membrane protein YkvI